MRVLQPRALFKRRFMWLLWLALLIPIGQTLATSHALSHTQWEASGEGGKQGLHTTLCGLCLTTSSLSHAAPPETRFSLLPAAELGEAPRAYFHRVKFAPPARAYQSRAPPFPLH